MTLNEIKDILQCEVITGEDRLNMEVKMCCGSDLMSDVLAFAKAGALLLTGLANRQVIRTAEVADIRAVVLVRGKRPDAEMVALAREQNLPLMVTNLLLYEACGRLYQAGLPGCGEVPAAESGILG
ncbi:MAG: DRTGG domain-containing protein [Candidatus Sumerlaeia bacterium]|nr:DRTGG domain-containing protein [Candidatus Sumerlaeia bacterium]